MMTTASTFGEANDDADQDYDVQPKHERQIEPLAEP